MNLYDVLGVDKKATKAEISKAYRKKAKACHPDVCKDADASERLKIINRAYEVLSDPEKRRCYDETGSIETAELHYDDVAKTASVIFLEIVSTQGADADLIKVFVEEQNRNEKLIRQKLIRNSVKLDNIARVLTRLKYTGDKVDRLTMAVVQEREAIQTAIDSDNFELRMVEAMRKLIADYQYTVPECLPGGGSQQTQPIVYRRLRS